MKLIKYMYIYQAKMYILKLTITSELTSSHFKSYKLL